MLETYSANIAVTPNVAIPLDINSLVCGCNTTHQETAPTITLIKAGVYLVTLSATADSTLAGNVGIQMYQNNVPVQQAEASTVTEALTSTNIAFTTLVKVPCSCQCVNNNINLTFVYTGTAGTVYNINVVVLKIK